MESGGEEKRTILLPPRIDNTVMEVKTGRPAYTRRTRHVGALRGWTEHDGYRKAFTRPLAGLKASA
jgi:hypothetical protein